MEKWMVKNKKADFQALSEELGVSEMLVRLMVNRGLSDALAMKTYLHPETGMMHSPSLLKDSEKTVAILREAIEQKKKIRIIGDYDVDGVVSTWVFLTTLRECGARVDYRIPDRIVDGYGININMVQACAEDGIDVILTCDNGIAAVEQVAYAKEKGITVLVTDHHDLKKEIPNADAVVNPKQSDCPYPEKELCGAAVAYKVSELLYKECLKDASRVFKLLPFVAIATVCDVMELTGENRLIVSRGLDELRRTKHPGMLALMEENHIQPESLTTYHLGYVIGPCLNATGRLEQAIRGVELLDAKEEDAGRLAARLKELNDKRKEMTTQGLEKAILEVETTALKKDKVLVVFLPDCHESLAGIIAGRLREKYNKPAIVLTRAKDCVKGSARSIEAYHIFEKLSECEELLLRFGGHPMAAGLSLEEKNIEPLRRKLNEQSGLTEDDCTAKVSIDIILSLSYLNEERVEEINLLEPFGKGNEKPLFAEKELNVLKVTPIGKSSRMFRFLVQDRYGTCMDALYFGDAGEMEEKMIQRYGEDEIRRLYQGRTDKVKMSVVYYPGINEYMGNRKLQIVITNYQLV